MTTLNTVVSMLPRSATVVAVNNQYTSIMVGATVLRVLHIETLSPRDLRKAYVKAVKIRARLAHVESRKVVGRSQWPTASIWVSENDTYGWNNMDCCKVLIHSPTAVKLIKSLPIGNSNLEKFTPEIYQLLADFQDMGGNPWIFTADENHFNQFVTEKDREAYGCMGVSSRQRLNDLV